MKPDATTADRPAWPWPDSLDALIAAPAFHEVLLENERVRVLDVRIGPGEILPVHTNRWPSVLYVVSTGEFVRRDADGKVLLDTRAVPSPVAPPPTPVCASLPANTAA